MGSKPTQALTMVFKPLRNVKPQDYGKANTSIYKQMNSFILLFHEKQIISRIWYLFVVTIPTISLWERDSRINVKCHLNMSFTDLISRFFTAPKHEKVKTKNARL